ncbi:hypothetical protein F5Y14DRAFT_425460 [Nemania sp. NC0429]|nr:hypothetical protein F5Y14DRAFT_425460 [Nemania sp. NC0429]
MAINEDVPGIEVTVRCNKQPLVELDDPNAHDDDIAPHPSTTKYIECVDDTEFEVAIRVGSDYLWDYRDHVLVARVRVDGKTVRGTVIRRADTDHGRQVFRIKGRHVGSASGSWYLRRFKFAPVKTIDDARKERVQSDLEVAKDLGTIEVIFRRAIECGRGDHRRHGDTAPETFELAEKSLKGKAVSHGTSYGSRERASRQLAIHTLDIPEDHGSILSVKFMYRSKDALKRELIIPRSPSRSPTIAALTPAERDRLARERLDELREQKLKREDGKGLIKREFGETLDLTKDPPPARPTKKHRFRDGREVDVVDLTDD